MRQLLAVVAGLLVFTALVQPARADADVGIVLESHVGERSARADDLLAPILGVLVARKYDAGTEMVGRLFDTRVSRPALTRGLPADFGAQAERGHRAFVSGKFEDAVALLVPLVDAAHANPGAFAADQELRTPLSKALVALALSHGRMGDAAAMAQTFGELVRSFPETTLSRAVNGPDAFTAYEQVRKELASSRPGKLTITTTDDAGVIFINEKIERVGTVTRSVMPGEYRVFVQYGKQLSRAHQVVVRPGDDIAIEIDGAFDAAVHTAPAWTGLSFATPDARSQFEAIYAADFASAIRAKGVAVIGIDESHGRAVVFGALINPRTGREIRRASIALEPAPAEDRLRALGTFLVDNRPTAGLDIEVGDTAPARPGAGARGSAGPGERDGGSAAVDGRWGGWKYLTGGAALVGFGIGGYLLATDGTCQDDANPCVNFKDYAAGGWAALGGAAVLTGITVYLVATGDGGSRAAPARAAYVVPIADGAAVGFTTRF